MSQKKIDENTPVEGSIGLVQQPDVPVASSIDTEEVVAPVLKEEQTFTKDQVDAMVEKARAEEKKKVYGKLDALKDEKAKNEERTAELTKTLESTRNDLDTLRKGSSSEMESVTNELAILRENNTKLETAIEAVATDATNQLHASGLKAYREKRLREESVGLPELVAGDSEEAIDASIEGAKKREKELQAAITEKVRAEVAADLPSPISPHGNEGRGPSPGISSETRVQVAALKGSEYQQRRAQLLEDAKRKANLIR